MDSMGSIGEDKAFPEVRLIDLVLTFSNDYKDYVDKPIKEITNSMFFDFNRGHHRNMKFMQLRDTLQHIKEEILEYKENEKEFENSTFRNILVRMIAGADSERMKFFYKAILMALK